uniref:Uncharacterized protein n=1 Tax=Anguilla anguilla TaxID=7936 RepID=A0A0E9PUU8_ANGAN
MKAETFSYAVNLKKQILKAGICHCNGPRRRPIQVVISL